MSRRLALPISLCLALLNACGGSGDALDEQNEALTPTLSARAGETTVWIDRYLERSGDKFTLHGRTSRNLTGGRAFVFDDVYGAFEQPTPRTFDLAWMTSELTTLTTGVNQFIGMSFRPSSGRADHLTARVFVRPRLENFSGSSNLYLRSEMTPVVSGGRTVYRVFGTARVNLRTITAEIDGLQLGDLRVVDPTHFELDLLQDHLHMIAANGGELVVRGTSTTNKTYEKRANAELAAMVLELTTGDAEVAWPPRTCSDRVRACLEALPAGATDLGACGEALETNACAASTGVTFDDVAFAAAMMRADRLLPLLATDAPALVGASRATGLVEATRMTIESQLEQQIGRRYPNVEARDAAIATIIDDTLDASYARPLDLVEPFGAHPSQVNDVAADALLLDLAGRDLVNTEYGRSLTELARVFRARHVAAIGDIRAGRVAERMTSGPNDILMTEWLSAHVEITVVRATGAVVRVYFEID